MTSSIPSQEEVSLVTKGPTSPSDSSSVQPKEDQVVNFLQTQEKRVPILEEAIYKASYEIDQLKKRRASLEVAISEKEEAVLVAQGMLRELNETLTILKSLLSHDPSTS